MCLLSLSLSRRHSRTHTRSFNVSKAHDSPFSKSSSPSKSFRTDGRTKRKRRRSEKAEKFLAVVQPAKLARFVVQVLSVGRSFALLLQLPNGSVAVVVVLVVVAGLSIECVREKDCQASIGLVQSVAIGLLLPHGTRRRRRRSAFSSTSAQRIVPSDLEPIKIYISFPDASRKGEAKEQELEAISGILRCR